MIDSIGIGEGIFYIKYKVYVLGERVFVLVGLMLSFGSWGFLLSNVIGDIGVIGFVFII